MSLARMDADPDKLREKGFFVSAISPDLKSARLLRSLDPAANRIRVPDECKFESIQVSIRFAGQLAAGSRRQRYAPRFIFMTDFCGSTLLVRAIAELPTVQVIEESGLIPSLAEAKIRMPRGGWLKVLRSLIRAGAPLEHSTSISSGIPWIHVRKESSLSNPLLGELLLLLPESRGIFLYANLESFLLSVLPREGRRTRVCDRTMRLYSGLIRQAGLPLKAKPTTEAEWVALHWLAHMGILAKQLRNPSNRKRLVPMSADELLRVPVQGVARICNELHLPYRKEDLRAIQRAKIFSTHSKKTRLPFGFEDRNQCLASAARKHAEEVRHAMDWAERFRSEIPSSPLLDPGYLWARAFI